MSVDSRDEEQWRLRVSVVDESARVWRFAVYPDALEGSGCFAGPSRPRGWAAPGTLWDPERPARAAAARARGKVRRYRAANRLNRLGTLTYAGAGCFDPLELRSDLGAFFRDLRGELGSRPLPFLWVPEWHPRGHGLHAHFAVGRYIPVRLLRRVWGHGFTHITALGNLPSGSGAVAQSRLAARYLSKYVAKTFTDSRPDSGRHRYDVAQGFQPRAIQLAGASPAAVLAQAAAVMSGPAVETWTSAAEPQWGGPPMIWARWNE